jgi:hypothetical protein
MELPEEEAPQPFRDIFGINSSSRMWRRESTIVTLLILPAIPVERIVYGVAAKCQLHLQLLDASKVTSLSTEDRSPLRSEARYRAIACKRCQSLHQYSSRSLAPVIEYPCVSLHGKTIG